MRKRKKEKSPETVKNGKTFVTEGLEQSGFQQRPNNREERKELKSHSHIKKKTLAVTM